MDALRASAMLLGIVVHLAWIFTPTYAWTPIIERNGNEFCVYLFFVCHMFRMPAFFLISGFFAALVVTKRGGWGFLRNRLIRLGIPFIAGWLLLFPLIKFYSIWGGMASGRIQGGGSIWQKLAGEYSRLSVFTVDLSHLWFLHYLLLISLIVLLLRALLQLDTRPTRWIRNALARGFRSTMRSRVNIMLCAVLSAPLVFRMDWMGISLSSHGLIPVPALLLTYILFFGFGWLLYRQLELMVEFEKRWRFHLILGFALSVPLFLVFRGEFQTGGFPQLYPLVTGYQIRDYSSLRSQLIWGPVSERPAAIAKVWNAIPGDYQRFIEQHEVATSDQLAGLADQVNRSLLLDPELLGREELAELDFADLEVPQHIEAIAKLAPQLRGPMRAASLNRYIIDAILPGQFIGRPPGTAGHFAKKWAFACVYSLAMWGFVFGFIGLFNRHLASPSPAWRYMTDSSYWVYLLHLPVLFQIQVLISQVEVFWPLKFLLYLVVTLGVTVPTYHYLVRSTLIGVLLNGKTHPFKPLFSAKAKEPVR